MSDLFLAISNELKTYDLQCLKFLCIDFVTTQNLEKITEGYELFQALEQNGKLEKVNSGLLKELLFRIKRMDLLKNKMDTNQEEVEKELQDKAQISPYRIFLFNIAEQLSRDQVKQIKFLLNDKVAKHKLADGSVLELFLEMERSDRLAEANFEELKYQMKSIQRFDLLKKIRDFEETRKKVGVPQQESQTNVKMWAKRELQPREKQQQLPTPVLGETYRMGDRPLGYCLIINNFDFSTSLPNILKQRKGTDADAKKLKKIFQWLQFIVEERRDLTAYRILQTMMEYGQKDHEKMYCFVCCILSHGLKGAVYGTDGRSVLIEELTRSVDGERCLSLAGKPKVFFIQACQGKEGQKGVLIQRDSGEDIKSDANPLVSDDTKVSIPIGADFLTGISTVDHYESYRHISNGSFYIQSLCKHLEKLCPREFDLMSILTEVNKDLSIKVLNGNKQMPKIDSTLRKKLIFPVPLQKPDEFREEEDMDTLG
ncbi:caspase-8-like isoform X1 [Pleurodeles waltl]|uniref:caspase-8-like isoform X1 n=1 Tax=Pleurodeles waltl TaxID=8319 RepID=UPI0037099932